MTSDKSIRISGGIHGSGIAVGENIQVNMADAQRGQLENLVRELRVLVDKANIPPAARDSIREDALPELESASRSSTPALQVHSGLGKINSTLRSIGAGANDVSSIADVAVKIAKIAGVAVATAAPFLAGLLS